MVMLSTDFSSMSGRAVVGREGHSLPSFHARPLSMRPSSERSRLLMEREEAREEDRRSWMGAGWSWRRRAGR